jgi:pimeloyl-ACP methyl ester carboxylesterase
VQRLIDGGGSKVHVAGHLVGHLVGHSWGGVIAAKAAFGRRDKLASLTLIEPSCFHLLDTSGVEYAELIGLRDRQRALIAQGDMAGAARLFVEYWMGPSGWTAMPARRQETIASAIPRLYQDWAGTMDMNTTLDDYRAFNVRTLLMCARDTRRPSSRVVDMIAAALPNAARAEIESGGHMSPLTNPEPVNDAIEKFLKDGLS